LNSQKQPAASSRTPRVGEIGNLGEPLRFSNVEQFAGFAAESSDKGKTTKVWTKLALTSEDPLFHRLVENFEPVVAHMAQQAGTAVNLRSASVVLLVLKPDHTAELWLDTAAVSLRCTVKRAIAAGTVLFENDIADVTGMSFPCVEFGERDKVLCIFREAWRFGFAFDMNPEGKLDLDAFITTLGTLHRKLRYRHLYDAIENSALFDKLLAGGWFPFVEIITAEFKDLVRHYESGFEVAAIEEKIIAGFDQKRLEHMFERWISKPHLANKAALLKEAIQAFGEKKPASVIKIVLTEIEGILNDAYRAAHSGHGAKLKELLAFAQASAEQRSGGPNTLLFPSAFGLYLAAQTFANFDPVAQTGNAGSRHAVGHGAAAQDSYTMTRALQALLTLDQFAFYT
jgi:hypothetical protein